VLEGPLMAAPPTCRHPGRWTDSWSGSMHAKGRTKTYRQGMQTDGWMNIWMEGWAQKPTKILDRPSAIWDRPSALADGVTG
jgi:hypothetical protein